MGKSSFTLSAADAADGTLVPLLQSLYVVTESQTLSFNVQTGLKVKRASTHFHDPAC